MDWSDGGYLALSALNVKDGYIDFSQDVHYGNQALYDKWMSGNELHKGQVLFTTEAPMGNVAQVPDNKHYILSQRTIAFDVKEDVITEDFLATLLRSPTVFNTLTSLSSGGTAKGVSQKSLADVTAQIPVDLREQALLADYFYNLDHLITLHQRKCNILEFAHIYDWEQRKLGDIFGSIGNAFVGTATPYYVEQGHFYLESNNVKDGQINHNSEIFINDEFYEKQKDKWLHTGDMVMVQSGHVGHAAVIPEELDNTAAHALIMFRNPKEKIEPYFLNYEYQTDKAKKKIENITTGNTIKHILASDMQKFVVAVPKYEEQKVIASYFSTLDHLITLHQRKQKWVKKIHALTKTQRKAIKILIKILFFIGKILYNRWKL